MVKTSMPVTSDGRATRDSLQVGATSGSASRNSSAIAIDIPQEVEARARAHEPEI